MRFKLEVKLEKVGRGGKVEGAIGGQVGGRTKVRGGMLEVKLEDVEKLKGMLDVMPRPKAQANHDKWPLSI